MTATKKKINIRTTKPKTQSKVVTPTSQSKDAEKNQSNEAKEYISDIRKDITAEGT